jgi:nitroreductase
MIKDNNCDFLELAELRQSDRRYHPGKPVEKEKILKCIEAARLAPSACNAQPWKFIVVDDHQLKNQVADATSNRLLPLNHFTKQAPVHVVIVREGANVTSRLGQVIRDKAFPLMDIGIAAEHFCLQAACEGLGTCMLGWFDEKKVKKLLRIPASKRAELIITLGYPASPKRAKKRKKLHEIVSYNLY